MSVTPASPIEVVLGQSKKADKFKSGLGLNTVGDLLDHFPRRYLRTGDLTKIEDLREGDLLTVVGEIAKSDVKSYLDRRSNRLAYRVEARLRTDGPTLLMTFFSKNKHVAEYRTRMLGARTPDEPGARGVFMGKLGSFGSNWQLSQPSMVLFSANEEQADEFADFVEHPSPFFPIYPLTAGIESWDVQRAVRFALATVELNDDALPESMRDSHDLLALRDAYESIHQPETFESVERARRRFRFEEALTLQLVMARRRQAIVAEGATARSGGRGLLAAFDASLPFELTQGQRDVGAEIEADLERAHPMHRLLQGDVGSGKTLVALRAMLRVVDSGGQAVLLAPTEVLAQQHYRSITQLLGPLALGGQLGGADDATRVELLTGSMTKTQRKEPLLRAATGEAGIVVGTHALLYDKVIFDDLGLIVVDEQHRFGVEQRAALAAGQRSSPHVLVMTATPIPRTVAMTVFGDLDVSTLTEMPAGRAAIQTTVVPAAEQPHWLDRAWTRVREEVAAGRQAYVVAPRIETTDGDDEQDLASVEATAEMLRSGPLVDLRLEVLHGKLPADDKDRVMRAFAAGDIDVLVSTTVIEVGVDVPNASVMVILDADRFGVSQLHQLRGRIGRGGHAGLCLLVTTSEADSPARERLDAVASTTDGFALSRIDLELRREGDVLGANQSGGQSSLENLRVLRDEDVIVEARGAAIALVGDDPGLATAPLLLERVLDIEVTSQAEFLERS